MSLTHAEEADRLLALLADDEGLNPAVTAARAQAHAMLALVEAIENLRPPPAPVPDDQLPAYTASTFDWNARD